MCCPDCCTAEIEDLDMGEVDKEILRPLLRKMDDAAENGILPDSMDTFREIIARRVGFYGY